MGPSYALPVIIALAAIVALIVLLLLRRLLRGGSRNGTYVAGGRNRKARLAVMDATAIDSYRRLVLVRRDDVEHLLLIGGSADVVVESNIRHANGRQVAVEPVYDQPEELPELTPPAPAARHQTPAAPAVASAPRPAPPARVAHPPRPAAPRPDPKPASYAGAQRPVAHAPVVKPNPAQSSAVDDAFDTELLRELEVELDNGSARGKSAAPSIDDEMSKLIGELTPGKR